MIKVTDFKSGLLEGEATNTRVAYGIVLKYCDENTDVRYKWAAVDKDGELYLYKEKPELKETEWDNHGYLTYAGDAVFEGDWKDSLVEL